jgi:hypothetical protein
MDTWNELRIRAQIGRLTAEQYGMDAENQSRVHRGEALAYSEKDFINMQNAWAELERQIREIG